MKPVRKVQTFHPLSLEEFNGETRKAFHDDLVKTCSNDNAIVMDYSDQILNMKEEIYHKSRKISLAMFFLLVSLLVTTLFICIQFYMILFS